MIIFLQGMLRKGKSWILKNENVFFLPLGCEDIFDIYENEELWNEERQKTKKRKIFSTEHIKQQVSLYVSLKSLCRSIRGKIKERRRDERKKFFPFHFHYFIFILLLLCFCVCLGCICLESTIAVAKKCLSQGKRDGKNKQEEISVSSLSEIKWNIFDKDCCLSVSKIELYNDICW
jgi:hypothetical protein